MHSGQNKIYDVAFRELLIDLAEISDSIDQLGKLARIVHILYSPYDDDARLIHDQIRITYQHIRTKTNHADANRRWKQKQHWDDTVCSHSLSCPCKECREVFWGD